MYAMVYQCNPQYTQMMIGAHGRAPTRPQQASHPRGEVHVRVGGAVGDAVWAVRGAPQRTSGRTMMMVLQWGMTTGASGRVLLGRCVARPP